MKVFVLFALFAVPITSDLCAKEGANLAAAIGVKTEILMVADTIFGHCYSLDFDKLLFSGDCLPLFEQAFWYNELAKVHYGGNGVVSYGHFADDIPNIQHLGAVSCERGRGCFNSLRDALNVCVEDPTIDDFVGVAINQVEIMYKQYDEKLIVEQLGMEKANSIVGELINILRNRFRYVVKQTIKDIINDDSQFSYFSYIDYAAVAWCDANCNEETGPFLEQLFYHMDRGRKCNDASMFCGQCYYRADKFLARNAVPCCLDNLVARAMDAVAYVRDKYDVLIEEFKVYLSCQLSHYAFTEALRIQRRVVKELGCLNESYEDSYNDCPAA